MKKYCVRRPEVHYQDIIIEAETPDDALSLVFDGEGTESGLSSYSYTLEPYEKNWQVDEIEKSKKCNWCGKIVQTDPIMYKNLLFCSETCLNECKAIQ